MSDIILIQPKVGPLEVAMKHPMLPLALLNISIFLWKDYEIEIIDQRVDKNWKEKLVKELNQNPICVGITSMTGEQISHALDAARIVRRESKTPIVWGGIHPTLLPKQTLKSRFVDIVVQGEGEITFFELVTKLNNGEPLKEVKGISYKSEGTVRSNLPRPFIDLNEIPQIPYHLVDVHKYIPTSRGKRTLVLQTSRGCPYRCTFCHQLAYNRRTWRALSPQKTLQRIKRLLGDFDVNNLHIIDDNFFVDLKRVKAIAEGIINWDCDLTWYADARIDTVEKMSKSFLRLLKRSGCVEMVLGVESGSARILRLIKKDITLDQVIDVNRKLRQFDIRPYYEFMGGFPTETDADLRQTLKLILRLLEENPNARFSVFHLCTPYPGTELFELAKKNGFVESSTLEEWSKYSWDNADYPWVTEKKRKILESLYTASLFIDDKYKHIESNIIRAFAKIYKPIARYRIRNYFFKYMIERKLQDMYTKTKSIHEPKTDKQISG